MNKWQEIIAQLNKLGWTQAQIGNECGVSQTAISYLVSGATAEPRHGLGEKLIALLKKAKKGEVA